jgi:hypothetical protein
MDNQQGTKVSDLGDNAEQAAQIDKIMRDGAAFITNMVRHMAFSNAAVIKTTPDHGAAIALSSLATAVTIVVNGYDLAGQQGQYNDLAAYFTTLARSAQSQLEKLAQDAAVAPSGLHDAIGVSDELKAELH